MNGKGALTVNLVDRVLAGRSILPADSLVADHYGLHGLGTSGQANGATFDQTVDSKGTMTINLLPGGWTITATAFNAAGLAIGGATATTTITVGSAATLDLPCLPYPGNGTLNGIFTWVPDVLAVPQCQVDLVNFAGTVFPMPITLDSSVAAHGTLQLNQGWYTGFERLLDNGVLSAGIVRSVRVGANMITNWSEFLTVNQLAGGITLDATWNGGPPLALSATPSQGASTLYDAQSITYKITGADNDAGTSLLYAWYVNGVGVAVGTQSSYTAQASSFSENSHVYLSCIVWQSNGARQPGGSSNSTAPAKRTKGRTLAGARQAPSRPAFTSPPECVSATRGAFSCLCAVERPGDRNLQNHRLALARHATREEPAA
jgi:hypothetical protein